MKVLAKCQLWPTLPFRLSPPCVRKAIGLKIPAWSQDLAGLDLRNWIPALVTARGLGVLELKAQWLPRGMGVCVWPELKCGLTQ